MARRQGDPPTDEIPTITGSDEPSLPYLHLPCKAIYLALSVHNNALIQLQEFTFSIISSVMFWLEN